MYDKLPLSLLAVFVVLHSMANGHLFFHEPSAVLVDPRRLAGPPSDFGFAMEYWNESLIVSSPSSGLDGEVYRCPLEGIPSNNLNCSLLDVFNTTSYSRDINPEQKFYLGASIAATKDYLFTCAPLVTKNITRNGDFILDAIGSCFMYANNTSIEHMGLETRFEEDGKLDHFVGGTGWNILADEDNEILIVAKTSVDGYVNYLSTTKPVNALSKLEEAISDRDMRVKIKKDLLDFGYGITAGKFFSNQTVYAVSKQSYAMTGEIIFLHVNDEYEELPGEAKELELMVTRRGRSYMIRNNVVGAMFGYCLAAADLNSDGRADLLVGAPLQSEDVNEVEFGAIHIYWGLNKNEDPNTVRTIFGAKSLGRFGTTIAASDIDGDSIPEVFVSAPYEDTGVVYILSGHALKKLLQPSSSLPIQVSELAHSQRVVRDDLALLGFSLLAMPDVDGNGCKDLAIGAPGKDRAILLRSFQTINVTVTLKLKENVKEKDDNFTVKVCVNVGYNNTKSDISGFLSVISDIDGFVKVLTPNYKIDLKTVKTEDPCKDIVVKLLRHEKADYLLRTSVELENVNSLTNTDFDKSWVQLSIYSETTSNLTIFRRCTGTDCEPDLELDVKWNPSTSHDYPTKEGKNETFRLWYDVESSAEETLSIVVENKGYETSAACILVEIAGAPVYKPGMCSLQPAQEPAVYECTLPTPFRRHDNTTFEMVLNMSRLSNTDKALVVKARPYEYCNQKSGNNIKERQLTVNYWFEKAWEKVELDGDKHDLLITDIEISEEELETQEESKKNVLKDDQQFRITNKGFVTWNRSIAIIEVENRPFITGVGTSETCLVSKDEKLFTITCNLVLEPGATKKIIAWAEMSRKEVGNYLDKGRQINVTSQMKLFSDIKDSKFLEKSLVTDIKLRKDISFKNNKMLIGLIAGILALLLLALVTCCLVKNGFFKREEKKKLNVLRESVRRRSIRLASEKSSRHSQKSPSNVDDDNDIDIEVVEDSPFEEIPISSKDNVVLIEAQAQVHQNEEQTKNGKKEEHAKKA